MPLMRGHSQKAVSRNISELHKGPQFKRTAAKFGKEKANKQAVAIAMKEAGKSRKTRKSPRAVGL